MWANVLPFYWELFQYYHWIVNYSLIACDKCIVFLFCMFHHVYISTLSLSITLHHFQEMFFSSGNWRWQMITTSTANSPAGPPCDNWFGAIFQFSLQLTCLPGLLQLKKKRLFVRLWKCWLLYETVCRSSENASSGSKLTGAHVPECSASGPTWTSQTQVTQLDSLQNPKCLQPLSCSLLSTGSGNCIMIPWRFQVENYLRPLQWPLVGSGLASWT